MIEAREKVKLLDAIHAWVRFSLSMI
jgi:hypothetical protein